jgi:hypothetical protein
MLQRNITLAPATIVRLCSDIIIKPNGQNSVLEIGNFPTSGFTGHDRNKPEKMKREEALEDLKEYARQINLPILYLGSDDLVKDQYAEDVREIAGLVDADKGSEVYFSNVDNLIIKINSLPNKEFNAADLSTYKCIVLLLTHVSVSFYDITKTQMPNVNIDELRKLSNVMLVDDNHINIPGVVFSGKITTNLLLNKEFKPNTLVLPRVYHAQLADEIISHFSPAKKILIKPSNSARGIGIIAVSLEDRAMLDKELQLLLKWNLLSSDITAARAKMQCDKVMQPLYYWYEHNLTEHPLAILQEFTESKPIMLEQHAYQAVTRVVFTYIHNNGENIFLIHGNPYLKIAAENMQSNNLRAALISKVHDNTGPQPTILTDKTEVTGINQQIVACFTDFFSKALKFGNLYAFMQDALISKERSTQIYALMTIIKFGDITADTADKIKLILSENPDYIPHFFEILKTQNIIENEKSILYQLTNDLIAAYPSIAVKAMRNIRDLENNFNVLLETALLPQFENIWQSSSSESKLDLMFFLLNGTLIVHHPDLLQSSRHIVTSDEWNITINTKLRELVFSDDANVAFPVLHWIVDTAYSDIFFNKENFEKVLTKAPFHRDLQKICKDYLNQANPQTPTYRYISLFAHGRKMVKNYPEQEYLLEIPQIVEQGNAIIADYQRGFNVNSEAEETYNIFCLSRDSYKNIITLIRKELLKTNRL